MEVIEMLKRILTSDCLSMMIFILFSINLTLAFTLILVNEYCFGNCCFVSLLFNAADPALVIAILGILLATQITAFGVLVIVITIFVSVLVQIPTRTEGDRHEDSNRNNQPNYLCQIKYIWDKLIVCVLLPSVAKTTIPSLLLLLLALYLQQAPPVIMWLFILGILVAVSIREILYSTCSTYRIISETLFLGDTNINNGS
ncbi:MAG: hypothetical protein IJO35_01890 [Methanocorpusculum sp.]|nr:hypothetical protein [Methanocorpusculum sp.]